VQREVVRKVQVELGTASGKGIRSEKESVEGAEVRKESETRKGSQTGKGTGNGSERWKGEMEGSGRKWEIGKGIRSLNGKRNGK
jgi:hypothetical protein